MITEASSLEDVLNDRPSASEAARRPSGAAVALSKEDTDRIFRDLVEDLRARGKATLADLAERYLKLCRPTSLAFPPLPFTGIKSLVFFLRIQKSESPATLKNKLATAMEDWRVKVAAKEGSDVGGADTLFQWKALRDYCGRPDPQHALPPQADGKISEVASGSGAPNTPRAGPVTKRKRPIDDDGERVERAGPFARSARGSQETFGLGPSTADPASLPRSNVSPAPGPTSAPLKKTASAESAKSSKSRVSLVRLSAPPISSSRRGSPISRKGVNQSPASTSTKRVERVEPSSSAQPAPRPDKGKGRASMTETATEQRPVVLDSEDDDHEVATQLIVRRKRSSVAPAVSPNSPERASSQQEESHRAPSLRPKPEGLVIPATDEEVDELEDDDEPPPQAPTSLAHQSPPSAEPILDVPAPSLVTPPGVASPPNSRADDGSRPWVVTARSLAASSARSSPKRPLSPEASGSRSPSRVAFLPRTSGLASNGLPRRLQPSRAPPTASAASKSASTTPAPEAEPSTVALGPVPVAQPSAAGTEALPVRQFLPPVTEPSTKRRRGTPSPYPAPIDDWEKAFIELDKSITKELQKQLDRAPPAPRLFDASPYASFIPQVGGGAPLAASIMAPAPISVARAFLLRDPHKPGLPGPRSKPARPLPRKSDPVHDDTRAKDSVASDVQNSSAVEQHNVGLEEAASQYARSHKIPVADLHSAVLHHTSLPSGASGSGAAPQFSTMAHASLPAGALLQGQWLLPTPVASSVAVPLPVAPSLPSPFPPTASRKLTADQRSSLLTGWPTYTVLQAETMKRVLQEHGLWDDALSILRAAPLPRDAIDPTRLPSRPSRPDSQRDSVAATETGQNTHLSSTFASVPHPQSAVFSGQPPPQAGVQMPPSASERLAAALFALYAAAPAPAVVRAELNTEALSVLVRALVTGPLPASELVQQVLDMGLSDLEIRRHIMSIAEPMTAARSGNWQLTDEALRTWLGADAAAAIAREDVVPGRPGFFPVNLKAIRLLGATIASANRTVPSLFALLRDSGVEANLFGPHVNLLAQPVDPTRRGEWWKMSNRMAEKLAEQKRLRYPLHTPTQKTPGVPGPGHDRGHSHASLGGPTASSDVLYRQSVVRGTAASSSQTQKDATAPRSTRITKPVHPPSAIGPVAAVDPTGPPKLPVPTQPGDLSVRITDQEVRDVLKSRLPAVKFSHHWRPRFGKGGNTWERVMRCLERVGGKVGPKPDSVLYHEDDGPLPGLPALDRDPSSVPPVPSASTSTSTGLNTAGPPALPSALSSKTVTITVDLDHENAPIDTGDDTSAAADGTTAEGAASSLSEDGFEILERAPTLGRARFVGLNLPPAPAHRAMGRVRFEAGTSSAGDSDVDSRRGRPAPLASKKLSRVWDHGYPAIYGTSEGVRARCDQTPPMKTFVPFTARRFRPI